MEIEIFAKKRKRAIREHKQSIVRTAKNGHRDKGRGLVLVKFTKRGVHLSYLTLAALQDKHARMASADHDGDTLVREIASYQPDSVIPILVTDGITSRFSLGVRQ